MPAIDRSLDNIDFLSDDFRGAIRRRLGELCGLVLIVIAVTLAAALATWSVQDPSLSHATDAPVRNLLGAPGAIAADLLIQLFGLGAIIVVLPVAIWGWRLLTHRAVEREVCGGRCRRELCIIASPDRHLAAAIGARRGCG
jgi:S-DNA-T family DNA segregation ATPase FtsK/SpoIIIE